MSAITFNDAYYRSIIDAYGYSPIDFQKINFALRSLDQAALERKFACHHQADVFAERVHAGERSIITTGYGLSGVPHLGTIASMLRIILFQRAGLPTQVVLGDLDAYNARAQPLDLVRRRVSTFAEFLRRLGYEADKGILRDQYGHLDEIRTAFVIAHYLDDEDFVEAEEDLSPLYKARGVYSAFRFPMKLSLLLMLADFIHLKLEHGISNVLVTLGVEEHKYVLLARKVMQRMNIEMHLGAIYGKIIKGLGGVPKMSKSIPGSSIDVQSSDAAVQALIEQNADESRSPDENVVFQMMEAASYYSYAELASLEALCRGDDRAEWLRRCLEYVRIVEGFLHAWPERHREGQ